ncbi:hypothetical protein ACP4OV_015398 [Aristida adscensionis]
MAHAARPLGRRPPGRGAPATSRQWPWPGPAPPPTPPVARRPDTPRRAAQDKTCTMNANESISTNTTHWQSKKSTHKEAHRANETMSRDKGILRPDSSKKHGMPRSSGGTYSKPDPRVKLIPAEEITYLQNQKPYCRHAGPAVLEKRNRRRSITPPPNSRKVSLVVSSSIVQKPAYDPCLSPKRLKSAENGHSCVGEYVKSPVPHPSSSSHQIASPKSPAPSSRKASQLSSSSLNTDDAFERNLGRSGRYYYSGIVHSQCQSSKTPTACLPKEAATNPVSPCPKPGSCEDHLGKMAETSSKNACTSDNVKLHSGSRNLDASSAATPVFQAPIVQPRLLSPTSVLGGMSRQVYPDRIRAAPPFIQKTTVKNVLQTPASLLSERSTEVHQSGKSASPQSTTPTQSKEFSKERDMGAPNNCDISSEFRHKSVQEIGVPMKNAFPSPISLPNERSSDLYPSNMQSTSPAQSNELSKERVPVPSVTCDASSGVQEAGASVVLHTKLHKKHYQSEAHWKGNFHVTGELRHICDGIAAHFPFEISIKVYEASKQMPEILKLEAVPLTQVWPKIFKIKPPEGQDIGLYFTSSHQRPQRTFDLLAKNSHIGLWTNLGDAELSIFSSKLLTPDYQRKDGKLYFWGVFGKRLRKKPGQPNNHIKSVEISNPSQPNEDSCEKPEENGMRLDMAEGKETETHKSDNVMTFDASGSEEREMGKSKDISNTVDVTADKAVVRDEEIASVLDFSGGNQTVRVNECATVLRTSDSNPASSFAAPAASLLDGSCCLDSSNSPCQADSVPVLDRPPGFSDISASLVFDTLPGFCTDNPPPGFTEAHRRIRTITSSKFDIPLTERKPIVDSSLIVSRPVVMEELSRFTTLLSVKKELESSAVGKGTEKQRPSSLAPGKDNPTEFATDLSPSCTEAHRLIPTITNAESETGASTPVTEKKSLISFSLNVPRLVRMEALPGFTTVRGETGSFTVDKVIDKQTPSSFPPGASSIGTDGKVGAMKISHCEVTVEPESSDEREFPRTRLLSDILGFSPASGDTASSTISTPRNCTEVCRAVSATLPDKQQQMEEPGTQVHLRKRGPEEPPEDITTKRPNVNGRIAINSGAGQAMNSGACGRARNIVANFVGR